MPFYTTLATDTFHRANENPLNPAVWGVSDGIAPMQIQSNEGILTAGESIGIYTGIAWPNDQWAQVQVDVNEFTGPPGTFKYASSIIVARRHDAINGYAFEIDGPLGPACNYSFFKIIGGVGTLFSGGTCNLPAGASIRIECFGTSISAIANGVLISTVTDTSLSSGQVAVDLFFDTVITDAQVSNFSGGAIVSSPSALLLQYSYTMLADIIANPVYPDAYRFEAAQTFVMKQQSGNVNPTTVLGVAIQPDGGEGQYATLVTQYEAVVPSFAGYISRAKASLGF